MSDEPTPPRTRLKPRLAVNPEEAPPPGALPPEVEQPSEVPADQATADLLRLRLKPRASSTPAAVSPLGTPLAPAEPPPLALSASAPPAEPPPFVPSGSAAPPSAPFVPPPPPAVPHLQSKPGVPEVKHAPTAKTAPAAVYKADKLLAVLAFVLAIAGVFYAVRLIKKGKQADSPPAVASAPAAEMGTPAAPSAAAAPTSTAGKLIAKARDAAAAHDQAAGLDDVLDAPSAPAPQPPAARVAPPPPPPGDGFTAFVIHLRVSGVFQGERARALLNGKMYRVGDVVDATLAIRLTGIEPDTKELVFEDATGATMSRRY